MIVNNAIEFGLHLANALKDTEMLEYYKGLQLSDLNKGILELAKDKRGNARGFYCIQCKTTLLPDIEGTIDANCIFHN